MTSDLSNIDLGARLSKSMQDRDLAYMEFVRARARVPRTYARMTKNIRARQDEQKVAHDKYLLAAALVSELLQESFPDELELVAPEIIEVPVSILG